MRIGKRAGPDVSTDAAQVVYILLARALFEIIAQNQDMDAREGCAIRHGRVPPTAGPTASKRSIPHGGPAENSALSLGVRRLVGVFDSPSPAVACYAGGHKYSDSS